MKIFFQANDKHRTGQIQKTLPKEQIYGGGFLNPDNKGETF